MNRANVSRYLAADGLRQNWYTEGWTWSKSSGSMPDTSSQPVCRNGTDAVRVSDDLIQTDPLTVCERCSHWDRCF